MNTVNIGTIRSIRMHADWPRPRVKYPKVIIEDNFIPIQFYHEANQPIRNTNKINSAAFIIDNELSTLSDVGKLFKLKAMQIEYNNKDTFWYAHSDKERYIIQLLEEIEEYGRIQPRCTTTKSIKESFPVHTGRTFQPYSFDRPDWASLQPMRKLEPIVKETHYSELQRGSTYSTKRTIPLL